MRGRFSHYDTKLIISLGMEFELRAAIIEACKRG